MIQIDKGTFVYDPRRAALSSVASSVVNAVENASPDPGLAVLIWNPLTRDMRARTADFGIAK